MFVKRCAALALVCVLVCVSAGDVFAGAGGADAREEARTALSSQLTIHVAPTYGARVALFDAETGKAAFSTAMIGLELGGSARLWARGPHTLRGGARISYSPIMRDLAGQDDLIPDGTVIPVKVRYHVDAYPHIDYVYNAWGGSAQVGVRFGARYAQMKIEPNEILTRSTYLFGLVGPIATIKPFDDLRLDAELLLLPTLWTEHEVPGLTEGPGMMGVAGRVGGYLDLGERWALGLVYDHVYVPGQFSEPTASAVLDGPVEVTDNVRHVLVDIELRF